VASGERRYEPRHVWLVPDEQERATVACGRDKLSGVIGSKVAAERLVQDRLESKLDGGDPRRIEGAHSRARKNELEGDPKPRERATRRARLILTTLGQAAIGIRTPTGVLSLTMA
jgi:hypothetical protein